MAKNIRILLSASIIWLTFIGSKAAMARLSRSSSVSWKPANTRSARNTPVHSTVSVIWHRLYQAEGRYSEAEPSSSVRLKPRAGAWQEHPDTLVSVNNLAYFYLAQGRYGEAEPLQKHAVEMSERVLGKVHPQTLAIIGNLALLYRAQGRYNDAEPLYNRILEASTHVLGEEHPSTLLLLDDVAQFYFVRRDWTCRSILAAQRRRDCRRISAAR